MALKVVLEWLGSCSGCEIAFLNMGEKLIELFTSDFEIVHAPLLMDNKYHEIDDDTLSLPEADLGIVSGCVNTEDHVLVLDQLRAKCDFLVAMGTCATHGGIPALMNSMDVKDSIQSIFDGASNESGGTVPAQGVPEHLERIYACDEKVSIDLMLPGCPPQPELIEEVLLSRVENREPLLPGRSVCETCPVDRKGKGSVSRVKRMVSKVDGDTAAPLTEMRCLLEQGFLCMGPVTIAGCASKAGPRCISARVPCRGCYGPVRERGNQLLDMMNAMTSNGIDYKTVVDRRSLLRFSGGHGLLRHVKRREV